MGYGNSQKCMTFDLNTGKYIATVGHPGQDPEAYGYSVPVLDESEKEVLYFRSRGFVKYSMDNRFLGSIRVNRILYSAPLICDTVMSMALAEKYTDGGKHIAFLRMDLEGNLIDSTAIAGTGKSIMPNVPKQYSNAFINEYPSLMPHSGLTFRRIKGKLDGVGHVVDFTGVNQMWQTNGTIRFHQAFSDTIYNMNVEGAPIAYVFDTGKWHYPFEETENTEITSNHAFVTDVTETKDKIIFTVSKGWFEEENKGYIGLYDKKTEATAMGKIEEGFQDDLAGFAPFYPIRTNNKGQLIGIMTTEDIDKWLKKHPDAEKPAFLDELAEDDNPVLVIVE